MESIGAERQVAQPGRMETLDPGAGGFFRFSPEAVGDKVHSRHAQTRGRTQAGKHRVGVQHRLAAEEEHRAERPRGDGLGDPADGRVGAHVRSPGAHVVAAVAAPRSAPARHQQLQPIWSLRNFHSCLTQKKTRPHRTASRSGDGVMQARRGLNRIPANYLWFCPWSAEWIMAKRRGYVKARSSEWSSPANSRSSTESVRRTRPLS